MLTKAATEFVVKEMTRDEFEHLDAVVRRGASIALEVYEAIKEIRDRRGYRFEFPTFEDYCQSRLGMTRRHADRMIAAAVQLRQLNETSMSQIPTSTHALELAKLEPAQVVELVKEVDLDKTSVRQLAEIVKERKEKDHKLERAARIEEITKGNRELSAEIGTYNVIYADPPWQYDYAPTESRAIENQYPTMTLEEICNLPISRVAADDCVLFLWATSPKLAEAIQVISAWGFTYKTCMVWVKDKIGMGYYARQQHELLLIAAKGNLPVPEPEQRPSSVIHADRAEHSVKPDAFYEVIEQMYPEYARLELFSRRERNGWSAWGNQS